MARHHYVPQFYMRNFKIDDSKSSVFAYRRHKKPERRNTDTVAFRNNFNNYVDIKTGDINSELEKVFSVIEDKAKPLMDRILATEKVELDEKERANLAYFVATLHTRTVAYRNILKAQYVAMMKTMMGVFASNKNTFAKDAEGYQAGITSDQIEEVRHTFVNEKYEISFEDDDYFLGQSLDLANKIFPYIAEKVWHVLKAPESQFFITSDSPLTIHRPAGMPAIRGTGGIADGILFLPLSPRYALVLKNPGSPKPDMNMPKGSMGQFNYATVFYSNEYVFSDVLSKDVETLLNSTNEYDGQTAMVTHAGKTTRYQPPR